MKSAVIVQARLTRYREPLFEVLRQRCRERGINLRVAHGPPGPEERTRGDEGFLPWADSLTTLRLSTGGRDLLWLALPADLANADLVILTQENRILSNYPLLLGRLWSRRRVAYWGHGANFQSDAPRGWRERWKRMLLGHVDWWFAYTSRTRDILLDARYPDEKITVLDNAIDNAAFRAELEAVTDADLVALRRRIGAGETAPVGLFCGSLYADKRLDYLVAAAARIHAAMPAFRLAIIGDGPARDELGRLIDGKPWIHATGALHGRDKAAWFRCASVMLNPGSVGLSILDAFSASLPLVTTREARHGPEIAYLEDGRNGLMVGGDATGYASAVVDLLRRPAYRSTMGQAACDDSRRYTLDAMAERFVTGIESCLAHGGNGAGTHAVGPRSDDAIGRTPKRSP